MFDFPSRQDLQRVGRDEILVRQALLSVEAVEREGSDSNAMVAAGAGMGDELVGRLLEISAGVFTDSAEGDRLDRLILDRYGLPRNGAAVARGSVWFTTTAPSPRTFVIPRNTKLQTKDGRQFVTSELVTFPQNTTGPVVASVRSVIAGADQQARVDTITSILASIPNKAPDLAVTNLKATAGAADAESDAD